MRLICRVDCHGHIAVVKHHELQQLPRLVRYIERKGLDQRQTLEERQMLLLSVDGEEQASPILTDCELLVR